MKGEKFDKQRFQIGIHLMKLLGIDYQSINPNRMEDVIDFILAEKKCSYDEGYNKCEDEHTAMLGTETSM